MPRLRDFDDVGRGLLGTDYLGVDAGDLGTARKTTFTAVKDWLAAFFDAIGTAAATIADHLAEPDPHTQYVLESAFAESVDDRVSALLVAGTNITLTYNDPAGTLTIEAAGGGGISDGDKGDITVSGGGATWTIDNAAVTYAKIQNVTGDRLLGRTGVAGSIEELTLGAGLAFSADAVICTITQYTDELAQDAVGTILVDGNTVNFTYNDAVPSITAEVISQHSIESVAGGIHLVGDAAAPGANMVYGTNGAGAKGWKADPGGGSSAWTTNVKTADQTNNTNVLADVTECQAVLAANTNYVIRVKAFFLTNATQDCAYRMVFTGTTTRVRRRVKRTATTDIAQTIELKTAFDGADVVLSTTGLNPWLEEQIILQVGAAGGTLQLQFKQVTGGAGPTQCLEGSYMEFALS